MMKKLLCLLLALTLLPGPAALAVEWTFPVSGHPDVPYSEMLPVTPFDETALREALDRLEELCSPGGGDRRSMEDREEAGGLYHQILAELDVLVTKANLAGVQYDAAGGAEAEAALYRELSAQQTRLYDRCYQVLALMAASPYASFLDAAAGEGTADSLLGYRALTEEEAALYEEEDRLIQTYDQIMESSLPAEERCQTAGEIYLQLVRLRTEQARRAGYGDYAEYAHEALYTRDYGLEEAADLREAAKRHILPLQLRLLDETDERDLRGLSVRSRMDGEEVLDAIGPFVEDFDPEMADTFAYLRRNHLYDIEYGETKLATGYTVALPAFYSGFIFNSPYGDYQDLSDTVHEFGHFVEVIHSTQPDLWSDFNIDVGEIDSQALELMFTGEAEDLFGEKYGEVYRNAVLYNILDSILDGCLYDEFQTAAYQLPDPTVEDLDRLFKVLSEEYGYSYDDGVESDPFWVENAHTFRNPMYFISYATSALSALDLWFLYLDAPEEGKEVYLELSSLSLSLPYRAAVEEVGLRDIFQPETVPALAGQLESLMNGEPVSHTGRRQHGETQLVLCVFALAAMVLVFGLRARPSRKERAESRRRESLDSWSPRRDGEELRRSGEDPWSVPEKKPPWEL